MMLAGEKMLPRKNIISYNYDIWVIIDGEVKLICTKEMNGPDKEYQCKNADRRIVI